MPRRPSAPNPEGVYVRICEDCDAGYVTARPSGIYCPSCKTRRETLRSESSAHCLEDPSPGSPYRGSVIPHIQFEEGLRLACWPPTSLWRKNGALVRVVGEEWLGDTMPPREFRQKIELCDKPGQLKDRVK